MTNYCEEEKNWKIQEDEPVALVRFSDCQPDANQEQQELDSVIEERCRRCLGMCEEEWNTQEHDKHEPYVEDPCDALLTS